MTDAGLPLVACIAMALYRHNETREDRAGNLLQVAREAGMDDPAGRLPKLVNDPLWATAMPWPVAEKYLRDACQHYAADAVSRIPKGVTS